MREEGGLVTEAGKGVSISSSTRIKGFNGQGFRVRENCGWAGGTGFPRILGTGRWAGSKGRVFSGQSQGKKGANWPDFFLHFGSFPAKNYKNVI